MLLSELNIKSLESYLGLGSAEAGVRQKEYGLNMRPAKTQKTWLRRLWDIFTEPMMFLILCTGFLYFFFKDFTEAIIILFSILPIGIIEFIQEGRTDKAIEALDKIMVSHTLVYRDGQIIKIDIKYLVPGDLVYLTAGDKIPADGVLINSSGLSVDESILTGESVAVSKSQLANFESKPENLLFQGTMVGQGSGQLLVLETGNRTKYGALGDLLSSIETEDTPLQNKIHKLVRGIAVVAFAVAILVGVFVGIGRGWSEGLLAGLTMAMSLIPEEFPVVFSVFLILGVLRLAKNKALTRHMVMVETLGSATVICTDKTGTLTEGRMALEKIYFNKKLYDHNKFKDNKEELSKLITSALLALEQVAVDPIEIETQKIAQNLGFNLEKFFAGYELVKDLAFDSKTKMIHHLWQDKNNRVCTQYSVGAPEAIINCCELSAAQKTELIQVNNKMAQDGYRVIAVAQQHTACDEAVLLAGLEFVGFLAMSDPPRAGVKEAIGECQKAGIRVIMITGDNKLTAHNIAENLKMNHNEEIVSGDELVKMNSEELCQFVKTHDIFARIQPEQKFLIVEALQKNGEIVAMTGDGVNDAPALKKANIGIAMGEKGTEVARAAAGLVLLDDNFSTIVAAVREGRRIYDNIRKSFVFLFSFHIPIVAVALIPMFFNQPLIFLPIHIIFLELICDPASVLGFERDRARRGLLAEPPRGASEALINPKLWYQIILQGVAISLVSLGFYYYGDKIIGNPELGRTLAFGGLVVSQIMLILLTREWQQVKSNKLLLFISGATLLGLVLVFNITSVCRVFHFVNINGQQLVTLFVVPFLVMSFVSLLVIKRK